jgi:hypothetical protein
MFLKCVGARMSGAVDCLRESSARWRCNFLVAQTSILPVLFASLNHGGHRDNRSTSCDHSGGLRHVRHDCASRGRQAENPARLLPARRLCVLDAAVRHRHGLRTQHLCAESFGPVEHPDYGVRPKDWPQFVLGPEHADGSNGLCAQSKNKLPVSLKSWAPERVCKSGILAVRNATTSAVPLI